MQRLAQQVQCWFDSTYPSVDCSIFITRMGSSQQFSNRSAADSKIGQKPLQCMPQKCMISLSQVCFSHISVCPKGLGSLTSVNMACFANISNTFCFDHFSRQEEAMHTLCKVNLSLAECTKRHEKWRAHHSIVDKHMHARFYKTKLGVQGQAALNCTETRLWNLCLMCEEQWGTDLGAWRQ